jgi:predicted ATP-grasp superfamily ATP-dependent carboligase
MTAELPTVDEVLRLDTDGLAPLTSPVLLVGLTGWFDVANVATTALDHLVPWDDSVTVGEIDPDPFYDFTQERPLVELVDGDIRQITWPSNTFRVVRSGAAHDLVVLSGVEPHLAWRVYAACILRVREALACQAVVTVGATADATPHTRVPLVVGSTASPELARRLGLSAPTYQGITGLVGVLNAALERAGVPTISLRVGVPHYLAHSEHPQAVAALIAHLAHVIGVPLSVDLDEQIERWGSLHDEAVAGDDQLHGYVRMLEVEYDRRAEATLRSGDDLADRFEEFLREQREEE